MRRSFAGSKKGSGATLRRFFCHDAIWWPIGDMPDWSGTARCAARLISNGCREAA